MAAEALLEMGEALTQKPLLVRAAPRPLAPIDPRKPQKECARLLALHPQVIRRRPAPVLAAGRGFVRRLRQVVADGGTPEAGLLRDLGTLRDEISALLEQLATKTRPRGGAGRARRSAQ